MPESWPFKVLLYDLSNPDLTLDLADFDMLMTHLADNYIHGQRWVLTQSQKEEIIGMHKKYCRGHQFRKEGMNAETHDL